MDCSEISWRLIIYAKIEKKIMKNFFGHHVIKIYRFFGFSVFYYYKTNIRTILEILGQFCKYKDHLGNIRTFREISGQFEKY